MENDRLEGAVIEEPEEAPKSSWVLVAQFFVVPVTIVALCVGIFILFGLITSENRTPRDYLEEVKAGKGNRRWQAAFELAKYLNYKGNKLNDPRLARDIGSLFLNTKNDDPRIRQYLARALGKLQDSSAVEPLIASLNETDPQTLLYIVSSLGELRDPRAAEPLLKIVETPDHDLRKMVIYSLGMLKDTRVIPSLQAALNDSYPDVRWNAALALARHGDASGLGVLHLMLDRNHLNTLPEANENQKSEAMINAARAVALLKDTTARPLLEEISKNDLDLKARSAAIAALKEIF